MTFRKKPSSIHRKKINIDKEVIRHLEETKRQMKEKIVESKTKKRKKPKND
jgi:hypothetical protein